jgi:hypothetical protein
MTGCGRNWEAIDDETGEPVHLRMGLTAAGNGPADGMPDFDHWGCWCPDPGCPGPPEEQEWRP